MAVRQLTDNFLTHRHREQARSYRGCVRLKYREYGLKGLFQNLLVLKY